jgi:peptidoglycan hydrolase-like protein with peptidoglycan-binding domain
MHGWVWRAASVAMAISLCWLPVGAGATGRMTELAQNAPDAGRAATEPSQPPAAAAPANTPEQVRKAQTELRRLDCLKGRIDGKLGEQTRQAVKSFWASAKQPVVAVTITDELIAELKERGDNYCRPSRVFFGFGGRPGGGLTPFLAPGVRPIPVPPPAAPSPPLAEP